MEDPDVKGNSIKAFQRAFESSSANPTARIVAAIYSLRQLDDDGPDLASAHRILQNAVELLPSTSSTIYDAWIRNII